MIKNFLKRIRKFFGLLELKGESNPYPLDSSPEIHVNTFSPYPDAYGNFENKPKEKEAIKKDWKNLCAVNDIKWNGDHTGYNFDLGRKRYSFYKNEKFLGSRIVHLKDNECNDIIIYDFLIEMLDKIKSEKHIPWREVIIEEPQQIPDNVAERMMWHAEWADNPNEDKESEKVIENEQHVNQTYKMYFPDYEPEIGPYHHSNDSSTTPYESDSSSNSSNDSSDW